MGVHLRSIGLLEQISKSFDVTLLILSPTPISQEQHEWLSQFAQEIIWLPLRSQTVADRLSVVWRIVCHRLPFHAASLRYSLEHRKDIETHIMNFPGLVFTSLGHWGSLVKDDRSSAWILNQCDADIEFWKVYARQSNGIAKKIIAFFNYRLSLNLFHKVYPNVRQIISVCEEDRQLTAQLSGDTPVDVIENGIDCRQYVPNRTHLRANHQLLFTGTSAPRNMIALEQIVQDILPLIMAEIPTVELVVAGNFSEAAQSQFKKYPNIRFTGRVPDIKPYFDQSDVYVAYFNETHGSKLKIAEAMSMAIPIVSTSAGVRGFPLEHGQSVFMADHPEEFATHVITLLKNKELGRQIGNQAREIALESIDWHVLGLRLNKILQSHAIKSGFYPEHKGPKHFIAL